MMKPANAKEKPKSFPRKALRRVGCALRRKRRALISAFSFTGRSTL